MCFSICCPHGKVYTCVRFSFFAQRFGLAHLCLFSYFCGLPLRVHFNHICSHSGFSSRIGHMPKYMAQHRKHGGESWRRIVEAIGATTTFYYHMLHLSSLYTDCAQMKVNTCRKIYAYQVQPVPSYNFGRLLLFLVNMHKV